MKLFVVLSVIAYGYAAKLDRTYLPPDSAQTAGGSPGSLTAPIQSGSGSLRGPSTLGFQPERLDFTQSESGFKQGSSGNQPGYNDFTSNGASSGNRHVMPSYDSASETGPLGQTFSQTGSGFNNGQDAGNFNQGFVQGSGQNEAQVYTPERPQAVADRNAEILRYNNENNIDSYSYSYETSNGISAEEAGEASNGVRAQGAYSYTGDDGQFYSITYTADENGYQPQGDHLPTPHPIPEEILKSIEENARAAAAGTQEGAYRPEEYESEISQQQYGDRSSGSNQPHGEGYSSAQDYQANQGQVVNRPQEYSSSQGQVNQGFINGQQQSGQGLINGQRQSGQGFVNGQGQSGQGFINSQGQSGQGFVNGQGQSGQGFINGQGQSGQGFVNGQGQSGQGVINGQGQSGQGFVNGQSGSSGLFNGNTQVGFNNRQNSEEQRQGSNGYTYKQPQNAFGSSEVRQGSVVQKVPTQTSYSGSLSGNIPTIDTQTQYQVQSGNQATRQGDSLNQGHKQQFGTNQAAHQVPHSAQSNGGNQQFGTTGPSGQGYQYNSNEPQKTFGANRGDGQTTGGHNGILNGHGDQDQYGNKQSFGSNNGQGGLINGNQNTQSSSQNGNQPIIGTNVQGGGVPSSNGSRGSQTLQAPYQYNRPEETSAHQQHSSGSHTFNGSNGKQGSEQFGGPRHPPSFSPEDGYKY